MSSFSILTNVPWLGSDVNFEETGLQVCTYSIYYLCYKIDILFIKRRGWDRVLLAEVLLAHTEPRVWFLAPQKSCAAMQACNPSTQTGGGGGGGLPSPAEQV